jgi:hypothetical protein
LKRGSLAACTRKRWYACTSAVVVLPPSTTLRRPSGEARQVPVWQTAQLMATRGMPTVSLEKPMGSSSPSTQVKPSEA